MENRQFPQKPQIPSQDPPTLWNPPGSPIFYSPPSPVFDTPPSPMLYQPMQLPPSHPILLPPSHSWPPPPPTPVIFESWSPYETARHFAGLPGSPFSTFTMSAPQASQNTQLPVQIHTVWAENLDCEFELIKTAIRNAAISNHTLVAAIDTEFPGTIYIPDSYQTLNSTGRYKFLKDNVDALKLIQIGLTLCDPTGSHPEQVWEFNISGFDNSIDKHHPKYIELLNRQGLDLDAINKYGIHPSDFAEYLLASGLLRTEKRQVCWVTFSGAYDFGYLVKLLIKSELPNSLTNFLELMEFYFGKKVFDVKNLVKFFSFEPGIGLEKLAAYLEVGRVAGISHQAGSDSLLTCHIWKKMKQMITVYGWEETENMVLCGLQVC